MHFDLAVTIFLNHTSLFSMAIGVLWFPNHLNHVPNPTKLWAKHLQCTINRHLPHNLIGENIQFFLNGLTHSDLIKINSLVLSYLILLNPNVEFSNFRVMYQRCFWKLKVIKEITKIIWSLIGHFKIQSPIVTMTPIFKTWQTFHFL